MDPRTVAASVRQELYRSQGACYLHRLHAVFLVARGLSTRRAAELLGDSPRAVSAWVRRYLADGAAGLLSRPPAGRKPRLTSGQLDDVRSAVCLAAERGERWTGKQLAAWLLERYAVRLEIRQCQRILTRFGVANDTAQSIPTHGSGAATGDNVASLPQTDISVRKE